MRQWLQIDAADNLAVALSDLPAGHEVSFSGKKFTLRNQVPAKHKFTLRKIKKEEPFVMYGAKVGFAVRDVEAGEALAESHIRPGKSKELNWSANKYHWHGPDSPQYQKEWEGYPRENGSFGTRNHWLVIPLVFCENHHVELLRESLQDALGYRSQKKRSFDISELVTAVKSGAGVEEVAQMQPGSVISESGERVFPNIDGIKFITHQAGCGGTRGDSDMFVELVVSYLINPNCGGATIISLGCQNAQMQQVKERLNKRAPQYARPIVWCEEQSFHGENVFLKTAISQTMAGLMKANESKREKAPFSALSLGLECGGSDGFSGISANPLLGKASDQIVGGGGNAILSEFPELNGVEQELVNRCKSKDQADRFVHLMKAYEKHVLDAGSSFDANPSPGNIREGLLTGAMKSAGAARKGGSAPVSSVLDYSEIPESKGLHLLCTPGNDVESTTALAASGANLIVFTTGLGTPTGNPLTPVIKMSSNTTLALKMRHLIDFDAGVIIGGKNMDDLTKDFLDYLIKVASGHLTKAEENGQDDFIPWKRDISL